MILSLFCTNYILWNIAIDLRALMIDKTIISIQYSLAAASFYKTLFTSTKNFILV